MVRMLRGQGRKILPGRWPDIAPWPVPGWGKTVALFLHQHVFADCFVASADFSLFGGVGKIFFVIYAAEEQRQGGLADFAGLQFAGNLRQHGPDVRAGLVRHNGDSPFSRSFSLIGLISVSSDSSDPAEESVRSDSSFPSFSALSSTSSGWVDLVASMAFLIASVIVFTVFI